MEKKKILVVDNHPLLLTFMADLLEDKGHQVVTAKDGLSAMEILQTYIPDIMFIDLIMPNIDGKKLCQIIRKMPKLDDVNLVILSAIAAEEDLNLAELGANACIAKGPLSSMAKYVIAALDQSDPAASGILAEKVSGLESVYSREITNELLSEKKHLEVILKSMSEGILEVTPEGKVVYANPAALSLTDKPEGKLLASHFTDLFSENDRIRVQNMFDQMRSKSQLIAQDSPVTLDGKQIELRVLPLEEDGHKSIVILNDVSKQKLREAQLQQAQKMESIGTLAAGIAHDFNNLLMGIQGYASLMLLSTESTHHFYDMLKGIEKQVKRGSKLTMQLLGYARKGKYEVRPINLNQLVKDTSETFGRTKKDIAIHSELAEDIFALEADQEQIEQALLNLYVNAADAMPGGGNLFLQTTNTTHDEMKDRLYDPKPGRYILLSITDTGMGMDKKIIRKIFDPFFSTKELGRGTGLGLASVYGIVKGHGGYIDVDSEKGYGTTFRIYLPATEKIFKDKRSEVKNYDEIPHGTGTVLLVDDEEITREVGGQMLKAMGYQIVVAMDGKEALEVYEKSHDKIDIVLLDIVMPNMGGSETYDRLRQINPDVKVILSSGYSINGEATAILERGCNDFIQKPFNLNELSKKLKNILGKK